MKRKRIITIEIERECLISNRERTIHICCPACGNDVEVTVSLDELEGKNDEFIRQIVQMAQGSIHSNHNGLNTKLLPPSVKTNEA